MGLLLLNAGSSSLKFSLLDPDERHAWIQGSADSASPPTRYAWQREDGLPHSETVLWSQLGDAVRRVVADVRLLMPSRNRRATIDGVVHRVVHGGTRFTQPARVTPVVRDALSELSALAPLH